MLEEKDIELLQVMMKNIVDESAQQTQEVIRQELKNELQKNNVRMDEKLQSLEGRMDEKLQSLENRMDEKFDNKLHKSENLILDEVERTRNILEKKISNLQSNVDELNQYYKIAKLENDNTTLILKMVQDLSKRVDKLEEKSA